MTFVLDASVTLAWFLDKPVPAYANRVRDALLKGESASVPALWHLEIVNGFAVAERRRILSAADAQLGLTAVENLARKALQTRAEFVPLRRALTTARDFGLSAYDGVYLDLARQLNLPLATLDRALISALKRANVALF